MQEIAARIATVVVFHGNCMQQCTEEEQSSTHASRPTVHLKKRPACGHASSARAAELRSSAVNRELTNPPPQCYTVCASRRPDCGPVRRRLRAMAEKINHVVIFVVLDVFDSS